MGQGKVVHFEIGVAMYGPFIFPEDSQPVSPIVWLCQLEEDVELKKPFELILPHYLIGLTVDQLHLHHIRFAKAGHDSLTEYKFKEVCDIQPYFITRESKSYGVLKSTHCCYLCIKAKKTPELLKDCTYCLARVELSDANQVYFIASYFLKTCIEVRYIHARYILESDKLTTQFVFKQAWKEQFDSNDFKITAIRYESFKFGAEQTIKVDPKHCQQDCMIVLEPRKAEVFTCIASA